MFERFRRSPEASSQESAKAELEQVNQQIAELKANIEAWNDPVQADRELMAKLTARQQELMREAGEDQEQKAA